MAVYVMFTKLTDEGRKTIKDNPDRIVEVNKEVEEMKLQTWNLFKIGNLIRWIFRFYRETLPKISY